MVSFLRSTHNIFAVAITNSGFKTAATEVEDWVEADDSILSLDLLTQVIINLGFKQHCFCPIYYYFEIFIKPSHFLFLNVILLNTKIIS